MQEPETDPGLAGEQQGAPGESPSGSLGEQPARCETCRGQIGLVRVTFRPLPGQLQVWSCPIGGGCRKEQEQ